MNPKQLSKMPRFKKRLFASLALPLVLSLSTPLTFANTDSATQAIETESTATEVTKEQGYIRDDLFIYMHVGSSTNFRILGSINASTPVEKLDSNPETNFIKIKDDKGRIGWIESKSYTQDTPVSVQLEQTQAQIQQLQEQNRQSEALISQLQQQLENSEKTKTNVAGLLQLSETQNKQLQQQINDSAKEHNFKQMIFGAGIIVVGLILGLILPHLIPRKRRGDHWV